MPDKCDEYPSYFRKKRRTNPMPKRFKNTKTLTVAIFNVLVSPNSIYWNNILENSRSNFTDEEYNEAEKLAKIEFHRQFHSAPQSQIKTPTNLPPFKSGQIK